MERTFDFFCGIDWGSEQHRVCLMDGEGHVVGERWTQHSGASITELITWLCDHGGAAPSGLAIGIEIPRGAIVEALTEHGFAVFSINPKQLDRFRDRYSPAGAKDDRRDAFVLADSLCTDPHCFHAVRLDEPVIIRLRDLSRLEDDIRDEQRRLNNQLREQWHRFFPQLLMLCPSTDEPWVWDLFEAVPSPTLAARLSEKKITRILVRHRIRRIGVGEVRAILATPPLPLAPGTEEAASEHALLLLPRLRLLRQQRSKIAARLRKLLEELASPAAGESEAKEHRDAEVLLSLPGVGRIVGAAQRSLAGYRRSRLSRAAVLRRHGSRHTAKRQEGRSAHAPWLQRTPAQCSLPLGACQHHLRSAESKSLRPTAC